jgi:outer membrane protein assembly factor BamB
VNGDGFADLVTGAYAYDNGQTDEGRVFVFHGGPGGLPPTANWTWEPNSMSARVCRASTLGDVNADGFADLIIYDRGYVFLGSSSGLMTSYTATLATPLAIGAGDVDGDGFGEVLRAWDQYTSGGVPDTDEGALYVHSTQPTAAGGRQVLARMLRGGSPEAPVQPWGRAYHAGEFKVRLNSTSFHGRTAAVKVEVEACPPALAFGSAGCVRTVSPGWTELTGASGATETLTLTGLASRTLYRWRARTLYAPATVLQPGISPPPRPAHGPWRRVFAQAREADLRTDQGISVSLSQATSTVDETNLQTTFGATMVTADGQPNLYPVTVQYQTADGTATAGSDYTATTASITWSAGMGAASRSIGTSPRRRRRLSEGPETFSIGLSSPANAALVSPTVHVVTIVDSDPPLVSVADTSVVEGNSGTTTATFTVTLSYASSTPASVSWTTGGGSATSDSDFVEAMGSVSFAPQQTSQPVQITVNGDTLDEGDEAFQLTLSNPLGAAPGDTVADGTIKNDDGSSGDAVTVFAATARNGRADLEWVYPAAHNAVRIRYNEGASCTPPTDPETDGTLLGDFTATAGEPWMAPHESMVNGRQYCYRIWTVLGVSSYAAGTTTHTRPFDNSVGQPGERIEWAYTTGASSVAAPGLGGNVVLAVSNDHFVHAMVRGSGTGAGLWPSGYVARLLGGPAQERPPLLPLAVVPGSTNFTLLGSQDGSVYAVDAQRGGIKWKTPLLPAGTEVQAAPSVFLAGFGAPFGIDFNVVVVGTRNGAGFNRFYALDAATGGLVGTPYDNGATNIGFVSGSASLDYTTKRAYFTSRGAGSPNTLWCFDVSATGLSLGWAIPAGPIDASPVLRNGVVYTSTIDGDVMAYDADDGTPLWTSAPSVPAPFPPRWAA